MFYGSFFLAFRVFGKKFDAISDIIVTKTADHVKAYYNAKRQSCKLDQVKF